MAVYTHLFGWLQSCSLVTSPWGIHRFFIESKWYVQCIPLKSSL